MQYVPDPPRDLKAIYVYQQLKNIMKIRYEILGLRLELLGLALLLASAIWQFTLSDKLDQIATAYPSITQEEVNFAILDAISQLSTEANATSDKIREMSHHEINTIVTKTKARIIKYREDRMALANNQALIFGVIRLILATAGATLIIIGKYYVAKHKSAHP